MGEVIKYEMERQKKNIVEGRLRGTRGNRKGVTEEDEEEEEVPKEARKTVNRGKNK